MHCVHRGNCFNVSVYGAILCILLPFFQWSFNVINFYRFIYIFNRIIFYVCSWVLQREDDGGLIAKEQKGLGKLMKAWPCLLLSGSLKCSVNPRLDLLSCCQDGSWKAMLERSGVESSSLISGAWNCYISHGLFTPLISQPQMQNFYNFFLKKSYFMM